MPASHFRVRSATRFRRSEVTSAPSLSFSLASKLRVRKLRLVLDGDGADPRSRTGGDAHQNVHLERFGMRRRRVIELGLILSVIFKSLPEPVERLLHVAFTERFSDVEPQRGKRQRLSRRLAQSFNLHAVDVHVLTDNEIQANASGNVGQFGAQIRIAARAKQFPKACAFRFHGKWLAGLDCQLGRILFQYCAGFRDHAHGNHARRLTG